MRGTVEKEEKRGREKKKERGKKEEGKQEEVKKKKKGVTKAKNTGCCSYRGPVTCRANLFGTLLVTNQPCSNYPTLAKRALQAVSSVNRTDPNQTTAQECHRPAEAIERASAEQLLENSRLVASSDFESLANFGAAEEAGLGR